MINLHKQYKMRGFWTLLFAVLISTGAIAQEAMQTKKHKGKTYLVVEYDPAKHVLELHNTAATQFSFDKHDELKSQAGEQMVFAISGTSINDKKEAYGLVFKAGKVRQQGAKFEDPSTFQTQQLQGIFARGKNGKTALAPSSAFSGADTSRFEFAVESTPVLLAGGAMHPSLKGYAAETTMSVVGTRAEGSAVFVIAQDAVSYAAMADFMKSQLKVNDAMVMRRDDTAYYTPDGGEVNPKKAGYGPIYILVAKDNAGVDAADVDVQIPQEVQTKKITDELTEIIQFGKRYVMCKIDPKKYKVDLFNESEDGTRLHDINSVARYHQQNKDKHIFTMNAGMFNENRLPVGLYIDEGETVFQLNTKKNGRGNFYDFPPNGVFLITAKGEPMVLTTEQYIKAKFGPKDVQIATQSGPMMVYGGKFNEAFNEGSPNLNIRNAAGVDKDGNIVFVISIDKVNFYEFSTLLRDELNCDNALYLDGFLSQWAAPGVKDRYDTRYQLGPLLSVIKK